MGLYAPLCLKGATHPGAKLGGGGRKLFPQMAQTPLSVSPSPCHLLTKSTLFMPIQVP